MPALFFAGRLVSGGVAPPAPPFLGARCPPNRMGCHCSLFGKMQNESPLERRGKNEQGF